jgi:enoyl-CoA hydratase/carnithine racemase
VSGRRLTGWEAVDCGIALRAVPPKVLLEAACALARGFAAHAEPAVRYAKTLLRRSLLVPVDVGRDAELDAMVTLLDQADLAT